jgi:hypothetical protein
MYSNIKNNSFIFYLVCVINGAVINCPLLPTQFYDIKDYQDEKFPQQFLGCDAVSLV